MHVSAYSLSDYIPTVYYVNHNNSREIIIIAFSLSFGVFHFVCHHLTKQRVVVR